MRNRYCIVPLLVEREPFAALNAKTPDLAAFRRGTKKRSPSRGGGEARKGSARSDPPQALSGCRENWNGAQSGVSGRLAIRRQMGAAMGKAIDGSFLTLLLWTTALSLPLMTAAAGARAEIVTVLGADGAPGADWVHPGYFGRRGGEGESVIAHAGGVHPITAPLNKASATAGTAAQAETGWGVAVAEAMAAMAARRLRRERRRRLRWARRRLTLLRLAGAAGTARMEPRTLGQGALAGELWQQAQRRIRTPALSSAGPSRPVGEEAGAVP